jgi:hypothetical protein
LHQKLEEVADENGNNTGDNKRHVKHQQSNTLEDRDDDEGNEEAVCQAGHHFLLICGLWLQ